MARRKKTNVEGQEDTQSRIYFSSETEDAIVRYNNAEDPDEREMIYRQHIAYPLDKLVENVINRFKFPYITQRQTFEDTKRQVVSYLVCNLWRYTQDKGKAFSYLSVIAKNYLILQNNNYYKQEKRDVSLAETGESYVPIEEMLSLEAPDEREHEDTKEFVQLMIAYWDANLHRIFKKKRDLEIASAIVELFRRAENIENFNKKALYLYIRDMTDCKTSYITKVVNKMRVHALAHMKEFNEHGTVTGLPLKPR